MGWARITLMEAGGTRKDYHPNQSQRTQGEWNMPTVDSNLCVACGNCAEVCPQDAITVEDVCKIDTSVCVECGFCIDECPAGALSD